MCETGITWSSIILFSKFFCAGNVFLNFIAIFCLPTRNCTCVNSYKEIKNSKIQTNVLDQKLDIHIAHKGDDV